MGTEGDLMEYEQKDPRNGAKIKAEANNEIVQQSKERLDRVQLGVRVLVSNPVSACDKLDKMFGSGGEAIVHYMWFESGYSLFDSMIKCNRSRSAEDLLKTLVDAQPRMGWGEVILNVARTDPPSVNIVVKNPPVKTMKGSKKQMIGSFWAGVFSRYFDKQLTCKNFGYDAQKDELSCAIMV